MRILASIYGGRAGDVYGDPIPAPSIYGHLDFIPAMFLGSVETRKGDRAAGVTPPQFCVIAALARASACRRD